MLYDSYIVQYDDHFICSGSDMNNMLPLLLLLRDNESEPEPTLAPNIKTTKDKMDKTNDLIELIKEMGLEDLAPIPSEWSLPSDGYSQEAMDRVIETMQSNPGEILLLKYIAF